MISIYSDPHIGLNLASNTTNDSRKRLRGFIQDNVNKIVDSFDSEALKICSGDFFHTYQNVEEVLYDSLWAASQTDKILAGNHDVVNIAGRKGTVDVLSTVFDTRVVPCKFGKVNYQGTSVAGLIALKETVGVDVPPSISSFLIPHHSSQELFEEALSKASESSKEWGCNYSVLITHCNYDSPFVKDDVMLNMTAGMAKELLEIFDYIILGHDHNHRTDHDDRLIVVGSPHPTNFGDIGDKYVVHFDEYINPSLELVWKKDKHYLECEYTELDSKITEDHQWVLLTGEIPPSEIHELSSTIRKAWKNYKPFAIKSDVKILTGDSKESSLQAISSDKLNDMIQAELKNSPEMYSLWKELSDEQSS